MCCVNVMAIARSPVGWLRWCWGVSGAGSSRGDGAPKWCRPRRAPGHRADPQRPGRPPDGCCWPVPGRCPMACPDGCCWAADRTSTPRRCRLRGDESSGSCHWPYVVHRRNRCLPGLRGRGTGAFVIAVPLAVGLQPWPRPPLRGAGGIRLGLPWVVAVMASAARQRHRHRGSRPGVCDRRPGIGPCSPWR